MPCVFVRQSPAECRQTMSNACGQIFRNHCNELSTWPYCSFAFKTNCVLHLIHIFQSYMQICTWMPVFVCMYIRIYIYIYIYIYMYIFVCIYMFIYIFIYIYISIYAYMYINTYIYIYVYIHIYMYMYIYIYICMYR